ncbi:hypothetical protein CHM34_08715 [Paludifilum halophilum]|uniref:Ion transport domain-containing protein n=1 Tax=Paludifilum halophilum TaxID=1642702 RepID=A0A235B7A4_9BACL|nr:hypothetical protein CHM34_08715 [Paludifilum halophilum]
MKIQPSKLESLLRPLYESVTALVVFSYTVILIHQTVQPGASSPFTPEVMLWIDWCLIAWFAVDYLIRLWHAPNKRRFVLRNWFDLVAMIPFESFFRPFRLLRLIRLVHLI